MELKQILEQIGLTPHEAAVYLATLELGSGTTIQIAKKAQIKRTTCYDVLGDLKAKNLVFETIKVKKRLFVGENPEKLKESLKKKQSILFEALPQFRSIYNISGFKPKIRFYEGKEGLKEAYDDALRYSGEILAFGSEDVRNILGEDWIEWYIKKRVRKGVRVRAVLPETKYLAESIVAKDQEQLRICKLIKKNSYPFSVEVDIYGHQKVALISSKEQIAVIIESAEINNTLKWIFELCWDNLPEVNIKPPKKMLA